ncbi:glycosyltransferase [Zoogloea dura]|uniref:Glycosyltransferase n=1 Tax=Zoogloea dura TaxID=2728840 RepID=A0A848G521_9RHOO|nr:glycosyltransferase [Zoogloea dura]NML24771.1 glycosyltransferase [Zoogloea dura]
MGFSVLMATYGRDNPAYLAEALESLVHQTVLPDEVILVEDGPLGMALREVIEAYRSRLPLLSVVMPGNVGLARALNEGLGAAHHELVARFDSDDVADPERFARQLAAFAEGGVDVLGGWALEIDSAGVPGRLRRMPLSHVEILASLWACPLIHPTVMYRREAILALGGYRTHLRRSEDYDLWFRCAKAGLRFANLPEALIRHRFDASSHLRHAFRDALERALTGYRGAALIGLPVWKRLACFVPLLRSMLPMALRHPVYRLLSRFDPRRGA